MQKHPFLVLFAICILIQSANAQLSGPVDYPYLGVKFSIPQNWVGQESEEGILMGSNNEAGLMIMMPHTFQSIDQIKQEAELGITDEGLSLRRSGEFQAEGNNGIGAEFSGTVQGEAAKAYLISLLNPNGGGVTMMAMTTTSVYSPQLVGRVRELSQSVVFSQPKQSDEVAEWKAYFSNKRLTYMNTYSSTDYNGGYSGYSDKKIMHLCGEGYFKSSSSSNSSFDTGGGAGGFGYTHGQGKGAGTWKIVPNSQGKAILELTFYEGNVVEYQLEFTDDKTYLNGTRYFVTGADSGADYAPDCP